MSFSIASLHLHHYSKEGHEFFSRILTGNWHWRQHIWNGWKHDVSHEKVVLDRAVAFWDDTEHSPSWVPEAWGNSDRRLQLHSTTAPEGSHPDEMLFSQRKWSFMTLCTAIQPISQYISWSCFSGNVSPIHHTAWSLCSRIFTSLDHWGSTLKGNISVIMLGWMPRCTGGCKHWALIYFSQNRTGNVSRTDLDCHGDYMDKRRFVHYPLLFWKVTY